MGGIWKFLLFFLWRGKVGTQKWSAEGELEKRRKLLLKSGDAANQKELYRKGGGRIQRTVNQGMSGTQGVAGAQKMEWELKGAA